MLSGKFAIITPITVYDSENETANPFSYRCLTKNLCLEAAASFAPVKNSSLV